MNFITPHCDAAPGIAPGTAPGSTPGIAPGSTPGFFPGYCRRSRRESFRGRGFTVVELLGAIMLSSLLVLALLMMVTSLGRTVQWGGPVVSTDTIPAGVQELVRQDLAQAREVQVPTVAGDPVVLKLVTAGGLDPDTLRLTHLPVTVFYEIRQIGDTSWLLRRQFAAPRPGVSPLQGAAGSDTSNPEQKSTEKSWVELVCPRVSGLKISDPSASPPEKGSAPSFPPTTTPPLEPTLERIRQETIPPKT